MAANQIRAGKLRMPELGHKQPASLLDRLLERREQLDRSSDSTRWQTHRAAALGLNDPTAAARTLKVAPGRVNRLIRSGAVRLYPVDERYRYVRVKEVKQALEDELAGLRDESAA
ncbi:hypothetical protein [Noviherbaspirillum pedocola]|uniref:Helix-turn-helix domain-containing protein n=1 Tax=Noviherbaspirillum pedocola TaxID=2801341 RepID=A0A934ST91_9BURK|nr:hypothetical protein [Noviherbaspirillum pedocola]MBK4735035.1 hypothetical protein [Noviherbaspirillum pedocola]